MNERQITSGSFVRMLWLLGVLLASWNGWAVAQGVQSAEVVRAVATHRANWMADSARFDMCSLSDVLGPSGPERSQLVELVPLALPCDSSPGAHAAVVRFRSLIFRDSVAQVRTIVDADGEGYYETYTVTPRPQRPSEWRVQSVLVEGWAPAPALVTVDIEDRDFPLCFELMFDAPRPRGLADLHGDTLILTNRPIHTAASAWRQGRISGLVPATRKGTVAWRQVPPDSVSVLAPEGLMWRIEGRFTEAGLVGALVWRSDDLTVPPADPDMKGFRGGRIPCGRSGSG